MSAKLKDIKSQSAFCKELAIRLDRDIQKSKEYYTDYSGAAGHTRYQADITRLRIELNKLSKMMNWDYKE